MKLKTRYRVLATTLANVIFLILLQETNSLLAPWSLHLDLEIITLLFPALHMSPLSATFTGFLTSLFIAATQPIPWTPGVFLPLLILTLILLFRRQVHPERPPHIMTLAIFGHLLWFTGNGLLSSTLFQSSSILAIIHHLAYAAISALVLIFLAPLAVRFQILLYQSFEPEQTSTPKVKA